MQIEIDVYGILLDTPNKRTIYERKIRSASLAFIFLLPIYLNIM